MLGPQLLVADLSSFGSYYVFFGLVFSVRTGGKELTDDSSTGYFILAVASSSRQSTIFSFVTLWKYVA